MQANSPICVYPSLIIILITKLVDTKDTKQTHASLHVTPDTYLSFF